MTWRSRSVPPVWAVALAGVLVIAAFAGSAYLTWIPVLLAGCVLLTCVIQLALQRKEGLVNRIIASVGGAFLILVVGSIVLAILHPTPWPGS